MHRSSGRVPLCSWKALEFTDGDDALSRAWQEAQQEWGRSTGGRASAGAGDVHLLRGMEGRRPEPRGEGLARGRVQRAGGARAVRSGARSRTRGQEDGAMGAESRAVALLRGSRRADGARHQLPPWAASVAPRGWSSRGYYRIGSLS